MRAPGRRKGSSSRQRGVAAFVLSGIVSGLVGVGFQPFALAHPIDVIVPGKRAGPILLATGSPYQTSYTSFGAAKEWLGEPDFVRTRRYQCIKVIRATWKGRARITFTTYADNPAVEAEIRGELQSAEHGHLNIHTGKGLRVGDTLVQLLALYPDSYTYADGNHLHHVLEWSPQGGRVEATTERGIVTELLTAPHELC